MSVFNVIQDNRLSFRYHHAACIPAAALARRRARFSYAARFLRSLLRAACRAARTTLSVSGRLRCCDSRFVAKLGRGAHTPHEAAMPCIASPVAFVIHRAAGFHWLYVHSRRGHIGIVRSPIRAPHKTSVPLVFPQIALVVGHVACKRGRRNHSNQRNYRCQCSDSHRRTHNPFLSNLRHPVPVSVHTAPPGWRRARRFNVCLESATPVPICNPQETGPKGPISRHTFWNSAAIRSAPAGSAGQFLISAGPAMQPVRK